MFFFEAIILLTVFFLKMLISTRFFLAVHHKTRYALIFVMVMWNSKWFLLSFEIFTVLLDRFLYRNLCKKRFLFPYWFLFLMDGPHFSRIGVNAMHVYIDTVEINAKKK